MKVFRRSTSNNVGTLAQQSWEPMNLVNPKQVLQYMLDRGTVYDLVSRCNSFEFRYINGYGKGYLLTTDEEFIDEFLRVEIDEKVTYVTLHDRISLDLPEIDNKLYCLEVIEIKGSLAGDTVTRNYNVIADLALETFNYNEALTTTEECGEPLTLEEVMMDILMGTVIFTALDYDYDSIGDIISYDIAIQGMSVVEAMDYLCSVYGLVWYCSYDEEKIIVYVRNIVTGENQYYEPINNVHLSDLEPTERLNIIDVHFRVYNYRRRTDQVYYTDEGASASGWKGKTLQLYDPFMPVIVDHLGNLLTVNAVNRAYYIRENMKGIHSLTILAEHHKYVAVDVSTPPIALSEIHADYGHGRRSIYRTIPYPYCLLPKTILDPKLAKNWRGELAHTYYSDDPEEPIEYFVVHPVVGFDGALPPDPQRVENIYEWDYGKEGWPVRVEWNEIDGQWEAIQQKYECPENPENEEPPEYEPPYLPPEGSSCLTGGSSSS